MSFPRGMCLFAIEVKIFDMVIILEKKAVDTNVTIAKTTITPNNGFCQTLQTHQKIPLTQNIG
ncbi:hypothetical protein ZONE111905_00280 [Zobellia nedashkovskayae]